MGLWRPGEADPLKDGSGLTVWVQNPTAVRLGVTGKSTDLGAELTRVPVPALPLTNFVTLSKLFNSKPQFVCL